MAKAVAYRLSVVASGWLAEGPEVLYEWAEVVAMAKQLVAGLGGTYGPFVVLGPGLAVLQGPEAGGWCLVLLKGWVSVPDAPAKAKAKARAAKPKATRVPGAQA